MQGVGQEQPPQVTLKYAIMYAHSSPVSSCIASQLLMPKSPAKSSVTHAVGRLAGVVVNALVVVAEDVSVVVDVDKLEDVVVEVLVVVVDVVVQARTLP